MGKIISIIASIINKKTHPDNRDGFFYRNVGFV